MLKCLYLEFLLVFKGGEVYSPRMIISLYLHLKILFFLFVFKQFNSNSFKVSSPRAELGKTESMTYYI